MRRFSFFDSITTGDDVQVGKPSPEIFLKTAKKLQAEPSQCLVFEDSPSGMEAGLNANMSVVVIPDLAMDRSLYKKAHQILTGLFDFRPEEWNLPPFEGSGNFQ